MNWSMNTHITETVCYELALFFITIKKNLNHLGLCS